MDCESFCFFFFISVPSIFALWENYTNLALASYNCDQLKGFAMLISAWNLLDGKQSRSLWPTKCWPVPLAELSTRLWMTLTRQQLLSYVRELSSKVVVGLAGTYWAGPCKGSSALAKWNFKERRPEGMYHPSLIQPGWSCQLQTGKHQLVQVCRTWCTMV